jgi:hypothetical protein
MAPVRSSPIHASRWRTQQWPTSSVAAMPGSTRAREGVLEATTRDPPLQPTTDLQRLYNVMRDRENNLPLEELLLLADQQNGHLCPPAPQSSAMSRTASHASSQSITQSVQDVDLGDGKEQSKPRLGRRGPLPEFKKARAAFIRKVGACSTCHHRKVKVRLSASVLTRCSTDRRMRHSVATKICLFSRVHTKKISISLAKPTQAREGGRIDRDKTWICVA